MLRPYSFIIFSIILLFAFGSAMADEPYEHPYPEALQISVETETYLSEILGEVSVDIPVTNVDSVNLSLRETAEALLAQMEEYTDNRIDMMATYRISGTKWAGFLITARAVTVGLSVNESYTVEDTDALYFSVQTYDMETGDPLTLADVFPEDSQAWALIEEAARELLYSYYPDETRDEEALEALITLEALSESAFLPCAGQLLVPFSLEAILPDHHQIVYLKLPYPDYRDMMFEEAAEQTDNSSRPMIAITLDDGPNRLYTQEALEGLARYGASATFFCIGNSVNKLPDLVRREMDYGHTVGAHSMYHYNPWEQTLEEMQAEYDEQKALYATITGITVTLLRPPGGDLKTFVSRQIGWPLIKWNKSISDTGSGNATNLAYRVKNNAEHGDIFLMHDTNEATVEAIPLFLEALEERGFMFATVDELLYLNGITPEENVGYYDGLGETIYPSEDEE